MTNVRADIQPEYKWDLSKIYADMDAFNADYEKAKKLIAEFPSHRESMKKSAEGLYQMFSCKTTIERILYLLYSYAHLNSDLDKSDNNFLSLLGKAQNLICEAGSAMFFVSPELLAIDEETTKKWFAEYPKLEEYRRTIEVEQRYRPYTLSDTEEKLIADLGLALGTHSDISSVFTNAEIDFGKINDENGKKIELSEANYISLLMNGNRNVRRSAFRRLFSTYSKYGNTLSALMDAFVKERTTMSKVRHFPDSLTASVFKDEVTPDILGNLVDTVSRRMDVLFSYYDVKREVLGLSNLHMYDIYMPLISSCTKKYTYEEATKEVLDTVKIFGKEYHDTLENGIKNEHWVDVYPTKGKRSGAYSAGCYDTVPYILLNFTGKLDDVSTFAHEAGHSMHSYFSKKSNPPQESEYTIFVAEVASTVNELLFCHRKLRETSNRDEKLSILNQIMETYKGTLFRQTMFSEFEVTMHHLSEAGETLTKDLLCEKYYEVIKKYFGNHVVCDKEIACEWMRIPHFYYWFYVYKYATSISAASSIVRRIETEGEEYIAKYLKFLSCGGSMSPIDSLKIAEIDLTKPEVIDDAINDFAAAINEFKSLM